MRLIVLDSGVNDTQWTRLSAMEDDGKDRHGHGTMICRVFDSINSHEKISIKVLGDDGTAQVPVIERGLQMALKIVQSNCLSTIINLSIHGDPTSQLDSVLLELLSIPHVRVHMAAGNSGWILDAYTAFIYHPMIIASPRFQYVGAFGLDGTPLEAPPTNRGPWVTAWALGETDNGVGSSSSYACAVYSRSWID